MGCKYQGGVSEGEERAWYPKRQRNQSPRRNRSCQMRGLRRPRSERLGLNELCLHLFEERPIGVSARPREIEIGDWKGFIRV